MESSPSPDIPQADFLVIIEGVLGPQFDKDGKQRWWCEERDDEVGFQVTDGTHRYFYEVDRRTQVSGVKRVWFRDNGEIDQVSSYSFRSLNEDFPANRTVVNWN